MAYGFIKLQRSLFAEWPWTDKEVYDRRSAYIDLYRSANYKTHEGTTGGGHPITYERGVVYMSQEELANRWHWDKRKVKRYLDKLQALGECIVTTTRHGTKIRLTRYEETQNNGANIGTADRAINSTTNSSKNSPTNGTTKSLTHCGQSRSDGTTNSTTNSPNGDTQTVLKTPHKQSTIEERKERKEKNNNRGMERGTDYDSMIPELVKRPSRQ